ncbi:MAG: alpha/beta hydrolase [Ruminococcaceae bacterium]|nr:alpha/beta hydrolase [Oscillospiraceae bacterium]
MAFEGFKCIDFEFDGLGAKVVVPNVTPNGLWALKTEYFNAFPAEETELLNRGWHIAFNVNHTRWAEPLDLERKAKFVDYVSERFDLSKKAALVGMSCGGLIAVKFAALYPEKVSCLYLDAPVMNLLSCPAALGDSQTSLLEEYIRCTGRTLSQLLSYRDNPIDKMDILLKNDLPIILAAGDSDTVVPYHENGALLEKYYKENNGTIYVFMKKGVGHHPHGLEDPTIIADLIEKHSGK